MPSAFAGKVALVTGGGSGLGEEIGKALALRGAKVVLSDINLDAAERVAKEIKKAGGTAGAVQQDTAKPQDAERVVQHAVDKHGALHYAVNNAGIGGAAAPAGEVDLADWGRVIDINLNGVLYGMRYQIPAMLKTGPRQCAIVNMASVAGLAGIPGSAHYGAAKAGIIGFTKSVALEAGGSNIRVNAIAPGLIDTPMTADAPAMVRQMILMRTPLGRAGEPDDIATVALFLVSDDASFVTGQVLSPNGGLYT